MFAVAHVERQLERIQTSLLVAQFALSFLPNKLELIARTQTSTAKAKLPEKQRKFSAMARLSIAKSHAFLLIYSTTSKSSLSDLGPIVKMLGEVKGEV